MGRECGANEKRFSFRWPRTRENHQALPASDMTKAGRIGVAAPGARPWPERKDHALTSGRYALWHPLYHLCTRHECY